MVRELLREWRRFSSYCSIFWIFMDAWMYSRPASVGKVGFTFRLKKEVPRFFSSFWTMRLSAGWVMNSQLAAFESKR